MKKWIKRIILTIVISIGIYSLCVFGFFTYMFYQESKSIAIGMKNVEGARVNAERTARIYEFGTVLREGDKYVKEGKYDLAIAQYKKAMELEGYHKSDEPVCRSALANAYIKSEQYELALIEVNWLIDRGCARQDVRNNDLNRKQLLEKLIESKKGSRE